MKYYIKNYYLFLILISLLAIKSIFYNSYDINHLNVTNTYIDTLEKEIENINIIKNNSYKTFYSYGKVIYQNVYKFKQELTVLIDSDNIREKDYVVTNDGFIGVVKNVYKSYIIVKLISNKDFLMQVKINDCYGILENNNGLIVRGIDNYCTVNKKDLITTSDLNYYDEIIPIGYVSNIIYDENQISNTYEISLKANFNNLNYVIILSRNNDGNTT